MSRRIVSCFAAAFLLCGFANAAPAWSQDMLSPSAVKMPENFSLAAKAPDINSIPVLSSIVSGGGKLFYLGERSGLHGWFIVKDGQIQMIYLTPDKQTVMIGAIFTSDGQDVTGSQINALATRNKEVYQLLNAPATQQAELDAAVSNEGGVAAVPGDPSFAAASSRAEKESMPAIPLSPGDRLYQDLKAAAGVSFGSGSAPEIIIIAAPKCPNCKKTWLELRESVKSGQVQVRLIPVYNSVGGEEANQAAHLLVTKDPFAAWDKFSGGDEKALDGPPDEIAARAVMANLNLVSKWNIKGYPYIVYKGKDGRIKIVQGRPERMAAVLVDLKR